MTKRLILTSLLASLTLALAASPAAAQVDEPGAPQLGDDKPSTPYAPNRVAPPRRRVAPARGGCVGARCDHLYGPRRDQRRLRLRLKLRRRRAFVSDAARHDYLMATNPAYASALSRRRWGTALAIVGGGVGMVTMAVGLVGTMSGCLVDSMYDSSSYGEPGRDEACTKARVALYAGLGTMIVSAAVGLSLALSGHGQVRRIRKRFLVLRHLAIAPTRNGARAGVTLSF